MRQPVQGATGASGKIEGRATLLGYPSEGILKMGKNE